jgi:trimeric autotransporter adhesin
MRTFAFVVLFCVALQAQVKNSATATVPRLVRINSFFHASNGSAASSTESAVFSVYAAEIGGSPLWQETQNVTIYPDGHYSLLLGSTRNEGLPMELFASGEPRWLGVQFQRPGEEEQPRVLLASVPYALKAEDADTLGGRPASSYMLTPSIDSSGFATNSAAGSTAGTALRTPAKPRAIASRCLIRPRS